MTTENKDDLSFNEQEEKSVAELEQEARQRREAELGGDDEEIESATPQRPEVSALNKRKKGKTAFASLVACLLLIILAWVGTWFYKTYLRAPPQDKQTETTDNSKPSTSNVRKNLGQDAAPYEPEEDKKSEVSNSDDAAKGGDSQESVNSAAAPLRLNKALALITTNTANASENTPTMTRQQEALSIVGKSSNSTEADSAPTTTQPVETGTTGIDARNAKGDAEENDSRSSSPSTPSPVRRIPFNPDLYVPELTSVPCSMDYRFVSDRSGKLKCTIAKDIYSASGRVKLIEKGTEAHAEYRSGTLNHGQGSVFIIVNKLRTRQKPYLDIPLTDTNAAGELGEAGVSGWIDQHWIDRFGGALMVGVIPDGMAAVANTSGKTDRNTDYTENSRQSMAEMAKTTLDNSINIPPTLYKNQGEIINLIIGQDIDFSKVYKLKVK